MCDTLLFFLFIFFWDNVAVANTSISLAIRLQIVRMMVFRKCLSFIGFNLSCTVVNVKFEHLIQCFEG